MTEIREDNNLTPENKDSEKFYISTCIAGIAFGYLLGLGFNDSLNKIWELILGLTIPAVTGVLLVRYNPSIRATAAKLFENPIYLSFLLIGLASGFTFGKITDNYKLLYPKCSRVDSCTWMRAPVSDSEMSLMQFADKYSLDSLKKTIEMKIALKYAGFSDNEINACLAKNFKSSQILFYSTYGVPDSIVAHSLFFEKYQKDSITPAYFWFKRTYKDPQPPGK